MKLSSEHSTMALFSDGSAVCWGENSYGECAHPVPGHFFSPTVSPGIACATDVDIDGGQGVAVRADGSVQIFGASYETLSVVDPEFRFGIPVTVPEVQGGIQGSNDGMAAYVVRENGELDWWGQMFLEGGTWISASTVTPKLGLPPLSRVITFGAPCGLTVGGEVWCWGNGSGGNLGDGSTSAREIPSPVMGLASVQIVGIGGGDGSVCAVDKAGAVWCWGENGNGELGRGYAGGEAGQPEFETTPGRVVALPPAVKVDGGVGVLCALTRAAEVYCWGYDGAGWNSADPVPPSVSLEPVLIAGGTNVVDFSAAQGVICMLKTDGTVWCLGSPELIGDGENGDFTWGVPVEVDVFHPVEVPTE